MRRMFSLMVLTVCMSGLTAARSNPGPASSQNPKEQPSAGRKIARLPFEMHRFRPRLTLQQALKLAEGYIRKERIHISSYFLWEGRIVQHEGEKNVKEPRWFFRWVNEGGAIGDYLEVIVSMDGQVSRLPSM